MEQTLRKIDPHDVQCSFFLVERDDLVANLTLQIGQFKIRGFNIRKSKFGDAYFVSPPHRKLSGGRWVKLFWTSKEDWSCLEKVILKRFTDEHQNK